MPDFSVIMQSPEVRALVQENLLQRAFHDALYPKLMYRSAATPVLWPANVGDNMVFTGVGLIKPKMRPLQPGVDPTPSTYSSEQWESTLQQYADSIDTAMPTSMVAIANLFLRNAQQLGLSAGQTINRLVRDRIYAAGLSGWTVANGVYGPGTSLPVKRLAGFTKARYSGTGGSPVKFAAVSASNPLAITVFSGGVATAVNVIGFVPTYSGDEVGPGTLLLDGNVTVADRAYVYSADRSNVVRVGGGNKVDDIGSNDTLKLENIRSAVSRFWQENVPEMPDGRFHLHLDPTSLSQLYSDSEIQRLNTALPDYYIYKEFSIGEMLGCVFFRNSEAPVPETVSGGLTGVYDQDDPFAGELYNNGVAATGVKIHRPLLIGQGGVYEYYQDLAGLITEAGMTGKVGSSRVSNNGIDVDVERVQLIIRAPLNRLQDQVSTSWKFIGDWPVRTDATTGGAARYKRITCIEHGE